jgi:carbamoyltransferase
MPNILAISGCSGHDTGAALISDGRLIVAVEEERLNRIKHYSGFPQMSIDYCLKAAGLSHNDIDHVGLSWDPNAHLLKRLGFMCFYGNPRHFFRRFKLIADVTRFGISAKRALKRSFPAAKFHFLEHHIAHASSAFFGSGFKEAAIITMDGRSEWTTVLLSVGKGKSIKKIKELYYPSSLGLFYVAFTHYLGFNMHDEYKVMGLASYGSPKHIDFFRKALRFSERTIVDIDLSLVRHPGYMAAEEGKKYYSDKVVSALGPARGPKEPITQRHMDIAASLQAGLNEVGVEMARHLHSITNTDNLCMAGGVALNGVMNWKIKSEGPFKNMFVQPAAGDGGLSVGVAMYINSAILESKKDIVFNHAYWGPDYNDVEICKDVEAARVDHLRLKSPSRAAARLLRDGFIIGWFQGKSEFGPRALGNRSILADPRKAENKDIVNARIKFREEFRPFAPSILEEKINDYFVDCEDQPASYMLFVAPLRKDKEGIIPAVTHIDGTCRVQSVSRETNPLYYDLINSFYELTGVPVVLNTSFNVKGEPIVNSPVDAMKCFYTTGLDFLIMGNYLLCKKPVSDDMRKELSE